MNFIQNSKEISNSFFTTFLPLLSFLSPSSFPFPWSKLWNFKVSLDFLKICNLCGRERQKREDHKRASFSNWVWEVEERRHWMPLLRVLLIVWFLSSLLSDWLTNGLFYNSRVKQKVKEDSFCLANNSRLGDAHIPMGGMQQVWENGAIAVGCWLLSV